MTLTSVPSRITGAVVGLLALVAASCGSSGAATTDAANEIASLESGTDSAGLVDDTDTTELSADEAALELSACLREQGLDVADIAVDADGNIDLRSAFDNVTPGDTAFGEAMDACGDILADVGFGGAGRGGGIDETAMQDAFLEFSDCIRAEGFEDIEDLSFQAPGAGRPGPGTGFGGDGAPGDGAAPARGEGERLGNFGDRTTVFAERLGLDPDDPDVVAALDTCSPVLDAALGGGPADAES